jgi:cyclomaltodextrinase
MARFLSLARGDKSALRLATLFQMIYCGAPSIYYGDEIGMSGGHDPANRGAFPWHKPASWDRDLLHEFQRLIALRRSRPALRRGSFQFLWAADGMVAAARQLGDETILAIFNASRETRRLDLPLAGLLTDETLLSEVWGRDAVRVEQGMIRGLVLAPRSARVFATPAADAAA